MKDIEEPYKMPTESVADKLDRIATMMESGKLKPPKKPRKFRMPVKGKINKVRLRQGYATIVEISENNAIDFTREKVVDGTVKLKDTFHAVDTDDVLTYRGRPLLIIPKKSNVPYNPNRVKNNTFHQKHIMSRMMNETLETAKKLGMAGMSIGGIILLGVLAYAFMAG